MYPVNYTTFPCFRQPASGGEALSVWLFRRGRVMVRLWHRRMAAELAHDGVCQRLVGHCASCGAKEFDHCRRPSPMDMAA